jgi:glutamine synthetase
VPRSADIQARDQCNERSYSFDELKKDVAEGRIDTVLACQVDMQGRLMGKRFQAEFFVDSAWEETHSCNYLLATDIEMETVSGYKSTSWEKGYGDYTMKPDLRRFAASPGSKARRWFSATCSTIIPTRKCRIRRAPS